MPSYILDKNILVDAHNIISIKTQLEDLFIEKITCIDLDGSEVVLSDVFNTIFGSSSIVYKLSLSKKIRIYYQHTLTPEDIVRHIAIIPSYSKYGKHGSFKTIEQIIPYKENIKVNIDYDNIGDAHISAVCSIGLLDENLQQVTGQDVRLPVSSDTVYVNNDNLEDYNNQYGYIDNKYIDDILLLQSNSKELFKFGTPKQSNQLIYTDGRLIKVKAKASFIKIAITVDIINIEFAKTDHTPVIKRISVVGY